MTSVGLMAPGSIAFTALFLVTALGVTTSATAQDQAPSKLDGYRLLRYEEDYSHLCDGLAADARGKDAWDLVKCVPIGTDDRHLSIGGEIRLQYERYDRALWGAEADDRNGYLLQRYMLHGDLQVGKLARAFLQLKTGLEDGRLGGPRPVDEDAFDLHQAFLDLARGPNRARFTLRAGRQEIAFGNSRLVTVREGANVRLSFDGLRASIVGGGLDASIFAVKPVQTRAGVFDDATEKDQTLMGLYVATPRVPSGRIATDIYYFDHRRALARFDRGLGREHRYTVGIRVWGKTAALLYDIDGIVQRGSFGDTRIAAWAVAADLESALLISRGRPRLGLRFDVGSGNKSQTRTLETFHPLYPRGPEVSDAPLVGASNRIAVRPFVGVSPHRRLTVVAEFATLWRQSTDDGLYGQGGEPVLPSGATPARLTGHQLSVSGRWALDRHAVIRVSGSHFWAGPFLSAITPGRNLRFGTVLLEYRF